MQANKILHINSSGRSQGSITREISQQVVEQIQKARPALALKQRDLAKGLPFINEEWIGANFTDAAERTDAQKQTLALSDYLVDELKQAEYLVIGSPIYNFSVPSVLKAWIDMIARARLTFRYTENGPEGLLQGKKAVIVMASGGVPIGSEMDFASRYLKQIMNFVGITDVLVIDSSKVLAGEPLDLTQILDSDVPANDTNGSNSDKQKTVANH